MVLNENTNELYWIQCNQTTLEYTTEILTKVEKLLQDNKDFYKKSLIDQHNYLKSLIHNEDDLNEIIDRAWDLTPMYRDDIIDIRDLIRLYRTNELNLYHKLRYLHDMQCKPSSSKGKVINQKTE